MASLPFLASAAASAVSLAFTLPAVSPPPAAPVEAPPAPVVVEEVATVPMWVLPGATPVERTIIIALQRRGIDDPNAIAVVLGNVKQESRFHPNICEGGKRISYWNCTRGGYGLIQWTSQDRVDGLARHARVKGLDPSKAEAQISYLFTEWQWDAVEPYLQQGGYSIDHYMNKTYRWIGWGIHGRRTVYAHNYAAELVSEDIPVTEIPDA